MFCEVCGKEVKTKSRKYCSRGCYAESKRRRVECVCSICGKKFNRTPSKVGQYCSIDCQHEAQKIKAKCICRFCGKVFYCSPSRIREYCGMSCVREASKKQIQRPCKNCGTLINGTPSRINIYCCRDCEKEANKNTVECVCRTCGKKFQRNLSAVRGNTYCSEKCKYEGFVGRQQPKGLHSPNWVGDKVVKYRMVKCPDKFKSMSNCVGKVTLHRLIVAEEIGRPLKAREAVHHVDGNIANNSPSNLELYSSNSDHLKSHHGNKKVKPIWSGA